MKKFLSLFLMLLMLPVVFSACRASVPADDGEDAPAFVQKTFPDAPPTLTVSYGETEITAWRGTYSWETHNLLGIGQAVQADSMHPLDAARDYPEEFPVLHISEGESVELYFDALYDSRTVRYYPDGWDSYDAAEIHTTGPRTSPKMRVKTGLYEIIAEWNDTTENYSGTVHYAFRVE